MPSTGPDEAQHSAHEGRLARSIGAHEGYELARVHLDRYVAQHWLPEGDRKVFGAQNAHEQDCPAETVSRLLRMAEK